MDTKPSQTTVPALSTSSEAATRSTEPVQRRRRFSIEQKRRIVEEALNSGDSFSVAARRHNINTNLLFKWRRQYRQGLLAGESGSTKLIPVTVAAEEPKTTSLSAALATDTGHIELVLAKGHRLTIAGSVCPVTLRTVLECLPT